MGRLRRERLKRFGGTLVAGVLAAGGLLSAADIGFPALGSFFGWVRADPLPAGLVALATLIGFTVYWADIRSWFVLPDVDEREREMREWCHVLNRGIEPLVGNDATKFAAFVVNDNGRKVNVLIPRIKTPVPLVFFTGTVVMDKVAEAKYASWDEVRQGELQTQLAYEMAHFELGTQASYRKGEFSFTIANEALASDVQDVDSFARHVQKVTRGIVICLIVIHRSLGVGPTPVGVHASPIVGEESDTPVPLS